MSGRDWPRACAFGTTLLGDISGDGGSWDALAEAPLRAVVFRELLGLTEERASGAWERLDAGSPPIPRRRPAVPVSVRTRLQRAVVALPRRLHPWRSRRRSSGRNGRGAGTSSFAERAVRALPARPRRLGPGRAGRRRRPCAAPVQRPAPDAFSFTAITCDQALPFPPTPAIVYCPRTHAAFGHPPHPFREFLSPRRPRRPRHRQPRVESRSRCARRGPLPAPSLSGCARRRPAAHGDAVRRGSAGLGRRDRQPDAGQVRRPRRRAVAAGATTIRTALLFGNRPPVGRVLFRGQWAFPSRRRLEILPPNPIKPAGCHLERHHRRKTARCRSVISLSSCTPICPSSAIPSTTISSKKTGSTRPSPRRTSRCSKSSTASNATASIGA